MLKNTKRSKPHHCHVTVIIVAGAAAHKHDPSCHCEIAY